jgi:hypothetical protein
MFITRIKLFFYATGGAAARYMRSRRKLAYDRLIVSSQVIRKIMDLLMDFNNQPL